MPILQILCTITSSVYEGILETHLTVERFGGFTRTLAILDLNVEIKCLDQASRLVNTTAFAICCIFVLCLQFQRRKLKFHLLIGSGFFFVIGLCAILQQRLKHLTLEL